MIELKGKYNSCKVFADKLDEMTISQLFNLLNDKNYAGETIRIMPDCHAGKGNVIGLVMTYSGKVVPNWVGADLSCAMHTAKLSADSIIDLEKLDNVINTHIPSGVNVRNKAHKYAKNIDLKKLRCYKELKNKSRILLSIGTLGSWKNF